MLEPVESLVYLYYRCTKCGEVGDEVRLLEAKIPHCNHICMFCGHVDRIKQIEDITFNYKPEKVKEQIRQRSMPKTGKYQKVFKSLVRLGYDKKRCEEVVSTLTGKSDMSTQQLFKLAVLQLDNDKQTSTNETG